MRLRRTWSISSVLVVALLGLLPGCASDPPPPEAADRIPWDQARVTEIAQQLAASVKDLRNSSLDNPLLRGASRGAQDQRAIRLYLENLRMLQQVTGQLARQLENGEGYEKTREIAQRIGLLVRDIQEDARRIMLSEPQKDIMGPTLELLDQLSPYYSSKEPLMPGRLQR
jgi:hypothetical protein